MAHFHFSMKVQPRRKDGGKLSAKVHFDYIARQNQYAHMQGRQEDFVLAKSGNLPVWAHGDAGIFWEAAEAHRSASGVAYREVEIGLQEELSLEDNIELLEGFMREFHIDKYAYTYAIHQKDSTLEQGHINIHAHLMFDERLQEKDRPLGPEQYFKRYRKNANGEKTGGYQKSREFKPKSMLLSMRKRWAEIVNEKFRERGIAAEITEKNNADRYDELMAQGREDEAELVNRPAAPHLGHAYRNDAIMERLRDMEAEENERDRKAIEETGTNEDDDAEKAEADARLKEFEEKSKQEQKLILFVNDLQIRRLARALQQERLKQRRTQKVREAEGKKLPKAPLIITAGDLDACMKEEEERLRKETLDAEAAYQKARCDVLQDKVLQANAIASVLGDEWQQARKRFLGLQGTMKSLAKHVNDHRSSEEQQAFVKRNGRIHRAYVDSLRKMKTWEKRQQEARPDIEEALERMTAENERNKKIRNRLYGAYKQKERKLREFRDKRIPLETNYHMDDILYAEKLAKRVRPYCKVEGMQPLKDLPHDTFEGREYYLLDKVTYHEKQDRWTGMAVRLEDDMDRGKAPVYRLTFKASEDRTMAIIEKAEPTKEAVAMYRQLQRNLPRATTGSFEKTAAPKPFHRPVPVPVVGQQSKSLAPAAVKKLTELVDEITRSDTGKINIRWNDDDRHYVKGNKSKFKQMEDDLYKGWSL